VHLDNIKVHYSPTNAQVIVLKNNIKIYIKIIPTCFGKSHHFQGAHYPCLLKLHFVKTVSYGSSVYD
jgi:hypothetical protein